MNKAIKLTLLCCVALLSATSCDLEERFYSTVTPDTFVTSPENLDALMARPFTHWYNFQATNEYFIATECTTDEIVMPQRGSDWVDAGRWVNLHNHDFLATESTIKNNYNKLTQGIAITLNAADDISSQDFGRVGLTGADKQDMLAQLNALNAYFYMTGLDFYGGMPIFRSISDPVSGRATAQETFDYIEDMLVTGIPKLKAKKVLGESEDGFIRQAAGAALLARLYFNSKAWTGVDRFADAAAICQDILDGKYGTYRLEDTWNARFGFDNDKSTEVIWSVPCDQGHQEWVNHIKYASPYNAYVYYDNSYMPGRCYNGPCLAPSYPGANQPPYTQWKLGCPTQKFAKGDLRLKPYKYLGNKKYEGMFLMGELTNPRTGEPVVGTSLMVGQTITLVDYINNGSGTSSYYTGDENSGFRMAKYPMPNEADVLLTYCPDIPVITVTEVMYMLAECKWRAGQGKEAAELINTVRKRNFEGPDPNPVPDNFDVYRLADEWMIEFIGECRRRTDLIRLGLYTTEAWWDHNPSDETRNLFPIPTEALAANPLLEQNPGY